MRHQRPSPGRFLPIVLMLALCGAPPVQAQDDVDVAMRFFTAGGAYCFRLAPEGVALNEETEWTVMVLAGARNTQKAFRIRTLDPGSSGARGLGLKNIGLAVAGVWRVDRTRSEFVERFSQAMMDKRVRARVVTIVPPGLAAMPPRQRAEEYLKFSDRGTRVAFDKGVDLTPDDFARFAGYVPD